MYVHMSGSNFYRKLSLKCTFNSSHGIIYCLCPSPFPSHVQEIMLFIQNLPTAKWKDEDVEVLLAEAFKLKFMFADAPGHLTARKT